MTTATITTMDDLLIFLIAKIDDTSANIIVEMYEVLIHNKNANEMISNLFITFLNGLLNDRHPFCIMRDIEHLLKTNISIFKSFILCITGHFNEICHVDKQKSIEMHVMSKLWENINLVSHIKSKMLLTEFIWSFSYFRKNIVKFDFSHVLSETELTFALTDVVNDKDIHDKLIECFIGDQIIIGNFNFYLLLCVKMIAVYPDFWNVINSVSENTIIHKILNFITKWCIGSIMTYLQMLKCDNYAIDAFQELLIDFVKNDYNLYDNRSEFTMIIELFCNVSLYNTRSSKIIIIKNEIFTIISKIIGGVYCNANPITRINAMFGVNAYIDIHGYHKFDNYINNLFAYINDIDVRIIINEEFQIIEHQSIISSMLYQLIDIYNSVDNKTKGFFAEMMYKLISRNLELFDKFDEVRNDNIRQMSVMVNLMFTNYYRQVITIALQTFLIYQNIFDRKIIDKNQYVEIDDKFIVFIGRILKNLKFNAIRGDVLFFVQTLDSDVNLIANVYKFIYDKICDDIDDLVDVRLDIINSFNYLEQVVEHKDEIIEKLCSYKDNYMAKYENFLDPITCKFIKNPVMIPNCTEIFERSSIVSIIYEKGLHPYTRQPLNIKLINEFNEQYDVVQKLTEFKNIRDMAIFKKL